MAEHFVLPPEWRWYILGYFFLAGLSGGCYALGTMLRLWGGPRAEAAARIAFLTAFPLFVLCPILLTVDLGQPLRFWHMLIDTTPGRMGLGFKYWSPMSVGSWAILLYGIFSFVSFLEALGRRGRVRSGEGAAEASRAPAGGLVLLFNIVGALLGLFVASYTGVLLSVSNQPVWSDTWTLGGLFLASALSASAALLSGLIHTRGETAPTEAQLRQADGYFALLELVLIVLFLATLASAGTLRLVAGPWLILWVLVALSLVSPLGGLFGRGVLRREAAFIAIVALAGTLALRAIVLLSAQT